MKGSAMQRRRRDLGVWAAGLLAIVLLASGCPATPGTTVFFDDPQLERAIRKELDHPFGLLTRDDLKELRSLNARGMGIWSLKGIEFCENLTWLDLDTNNISDLTPLANLTNLMILNLDSNEIFELSPLAGLLNLDGVSLFDNQVGDIQARVTNAVNGGLGPGDFVVLDYETLSNRALNIDVPALEAMGVNVELVVPADKQNN